jgi:hypothetical protein
VNVAKSHVSLASFDPAEIRSIKPALCRESFLGILSIRPQFANSFTEANQYVGFRPHVGKLGQLRSMSPRVISIILAFHGVCHSAPSKGNRGPFR